MPIYEYRCADCGFQDEYLQKISEPALTQCPVCSKASFQKLLSAAGFHLKGSGWYATDFKGGKKPERKEPEKKEPEKKDSKTETKTDTKTETKSEAPA